MNPATSLKQMRIIHFSFLVAVAVYAYVGELYAGRNKPAVPPGLLYALVFLACLDALLAYYFRRTKLDAATEKLRRDSTDLGALMQWRQNIIVTLVLVLSIDIYGFALRFLGAPRAVAGGFYFVSLILMLAWRPKLELPAGAVGGVRNQ